MVTCKQIAEMVGVSRQAAASVLNRAPVCLVSGEKRDRILQLAQELHYVRNNAARTLARGKSGVIGILTGGLHIRKSHLNLILLDEELRKAGYLPCIVYTKSEDAHIVEGIRSLVRQNVDGIIVNSASNRIAKLLLSDGLTGLVPTVFVDSTSEPAGGYEIVYDFSPFTEELLHRAGERRIRNVAAFTCDDPAKEYPVRELIRNLLPRFGVPYQEFPLIRRSHIMDPERDRIQLFERVKEQIGTMEHYDLLLFEQGTCAAAVLSLLQKRWRIPEETGAVAFAGFDSAGSFYPALTAPDIVPENMAQAACQLLERLLRKPDLPPCQVKVPVRMTIRDTF